jgi:hypothetical protein
MAETVATLRKSPKKKVDVSANNNKDIEFTFRLRRPAHPKNPAFKGLWELTIKDSENSEWEIISDADGLYYCLENVHGILENMGL